MNNIIQQLPSYIIVILVAVVAGGLVSFIIVFIHAYIRGRDISIWPPRIGPAVNAKTAKSSTTSIRKNSKSTTGSLNANLELLKIEQDGKTISLDLSPAIAMGQIVGIDEDLIRRHLVRKIRAHREAFSVSRQSALIPFLGKYFGIFSWHKNVVTCHSIFSLPEDANAEMWESWSRMLLNYNDAYASKQRIHGSSFSQYDLRRMVERISSGINEAAKYLSKFPAKGNTGTQLTLYQAQQVLEKTRVALESERVNDLNIIAVDLEMAFSYLHDLIDNLMPDISFK